MHHQMQDTAVEGNARKKKAMCLMQMLSMNILSKDNFQHGLQVEQLKIIQFKPYFLIDGGRQLAPGLQPLLQHTDYKRPQEETLYAEPILVNHNVNVSNPLGRNLQICTFTLKLFFSQEQPWGANLSTK